MIKTGKKWMRDAWKERADPSVMTCSQVIATQEAYASLVWKIQVSALKVPSLRPDTLAATSQPSLDRDEQLPVQSCAFLRWWVGPPSIRKEMVLSSGQLTSHSPGHCLLLSPHSPTLPQALPCSNNIWWALTLLLPQGQIGHTQVSRSVFQLIKPPHIPLSWEF